MSQAPADRSVVDVLKEAEAALDAKIHGLKKAKAAFESGRRKIEKQPSSRKTLEKVVSDYEKLPAEASEAATSALSVVLHSLRKRLHDLSSNLERQMQHELQRLAAEKGLNCCVVAGTLTLGPFALSLDQSHERASLTYATFPVSERLPLEAEKIVTECEQQSQIILGPPEDLSRVAAEVEQAVRVAIVRTRKNPTGNELRAELPAVYREMVYIRQPQSRPLTKSSVREYPLPRFVVELKTLIQSDLNVSGKKRFRLETAVIENTRNTKKSVYIPNDLNKGYGEGMYYQALVLLDQA
jgi:hypothetical protein